MSMSDEQFRILIETIRSLGPTATATPTEEAKSKGSFSNCKARFGGQRDHDAVDEFVTAIETYKEIEGINDTDALKGISLLFQDIAVTWWKGVRREAKTWQDALQLLRDHFSPTKPAYQIYMEIFEEKQAERVAIDTFVCQKRALLAKLPEGRHDEETELDFIYGLMNLKYRQHLPRHELKSFRDLLEKGRNVERNRTGSSPSITRHFSKTVEDWEDPSVAHTNYLKKRVNVITDKLPRTKTAIIDGFQIEFVEESPDRYKAIIPESVCQNELNDALNLYKECEITTFGSDNLPTKMTGRFEPIKK